MRARQLRVTDFSLFLMVKHPKDDLAQLPLQLGLVAKRIWKAGEARTTPKGNPLSGTYQDSYCGLAIETAIGTPLSDAIDTFVARIRPNREALDQLHRTGGNSQLVIHWDSPGNTGETFEPSLLLTLADLNIALGIDVYGSDPA